MPREKDPRTCLVKLYLTPEENRAVRAAAKRLGLDAPHLVRLVLFQGGLACGRCGGERFGAERCRRCGWSVFGDHDPTPEQILEIVAQMRSEWPQRRLLWKGGR